MKNSCFEVYFGWANGVVVGKVHLDMENSVLVGCAFRPLNVGLPRQKVSRIYD